MIESFWQVGKGLKEGVNIDEFVKNLTLDIDKERNNRRQHIVILDIQTEDFRSFKLGIDFKEISDESRIEYLWVGNAPAPNLPQDRFTTNNINYLISQTIPNLIGNLPDCSLKELLLKLKENMFFDLGEKESVGSTEQNYERYRFIWDLSKFGFDLTPQKIRDEIKKEPANKKAKKAINIVSKFLMQVIEDTTRLTEEDIALFTLSVNGAPLVNYNEYKEYIYKKLIEEAFKDSKKGICHICNEEKEITWDTTKFWFKFYMTDKIGFSSNLGGGENFLKNYSLCKDCYQAVLLAEVFVRNNLKTSLSNYQVYILPSFQLNQLMPVKKLERWAEYFKDKFSAVASLKGLYNFQSKLEEYMDYQNLQDNFILNFLFAEKSKAAFKIFQLIQDVPPSRLDEIMSAGSDVQEMGEKIFKEDSWYLSLDKMFYLFPIGKDKNLKLKFTLNFYNSLFSYTPMESKALLREFIKRIWEIRFLKDFDDIEFSRTILFQNFLFYYLDKLNLLIRGEAMANSFDFLDTLEVNENVRKFLKEAKYDEKKTSLFLLGQLIGEIGRAQFNKGDKKKSILNKLNFQGMDLNKVMRLFNEVFEKMRQYKVLTSETEKIYGLSKKLFEAHKSDWGLTPQENVFYILSGYSFTTYTAITSGKQKPLEEEEVANE